MNQASEGPRPSGGVLGSEEIKRRVNDIFTGDSWAVESVKEASYDLRVARDWLKVGGKLYPLGTAYLAPYLSIQPGEFALLSTIETFDLAGDLSGRLGIKFKFARQGLTPLFGFQVDPYYGSGYANERLYLWVSNLGPERILIEPGDGVFVIEFHTVEGEVSNIQESRPYLAPQIQRDAAELGAESTVGFVDAIEKRLVTQYETRLQGFESRVQSVERGTQQVIFFGVFLVASALLAGSITALFAMIFAVDPGEGSTLTKALSTPAVRNLLVAVAVLLAVALVGLVGLAIFYLLRRLDQ